MDFQTSVDRVERELVRLGGHGLETARLVPGRR